MARNNKPLTIYNYMKLPDGTELLITKIENLGLPNQEVTHYISQEQRQKFTGKMMENASQVMSEYYEQLGMRD